MWNVVDSALQLCLYEHNPFFHPHSSWFFQTTQDNETQFTRKQGIWFRIQVSVNDKHLAASRREVFPTTELNTDTQWWWWADHWTKRSQWSFPTFMILWCVSVPGWQAESSPLLHICLNSIIVSCWNHRMLVSIYPVDSTMTREMSWGQHLAFAFLPQNWLWHSLYSYRLCVTITSMSQDHWHRATRINITK